MTVRCSDCAFLERLVVPQSTDRTTVPADRYRREQKARGDLVCFKQVATFGDASHLADRECGEFVRWDPVYSPKEHIDVQGLIQQRRSDRLLTILLWSLTTATALTMGLLNYCGK